ncbi:hypothetical protein L596_025889 [Steinernema carpocapsae]|uniref:Uncharacterized protein n=1 Tax=Steinernema carpocapsae TaxID=34508 RepID=A0A4U5MAK9_STECR|nr:hypothetical protein L596_025889 [Steinernema carpocapsae]
MWTAADKPIHSKSNLRRLQSQNDATDGRYFPSFLASRKLEQEIDVHSCVRCPAQNLYPPIYLLSKTSLHLLMEHQRPITQTINVNLVSYLLLHSIFTCIKVGFPSNLIKVKQIFVIVLCSLSLFASLRSSFTR